MKDKLGETEFDVYASQYKAMLARNLAISGEEPDYFAEYKMRDFDSTAMSHGLPKDGSFLDFGSGIGTSVIPFSKVLPMAILVCADVSGDSLEHSRTAHGDLAEYVPISGSVLPFKDGEFDGAFACCVLHHIDHALHEQTLREIRRVIRPGGILMIYEHNPYNPLTVSAVRNCPFDENAVLISARDLKRTFRAAGFTRFQLAYRVFFPTALKSLRGLEARLRWLPLGAQYSLTAKI